MQIALPRTQDAGKIQEQMQQKGQNIQDMLAQTQLVQEELKRKKINEANHKDKAMIRKDEQSGQKKPTKNLSYNKSKKDIKSLSHPYLGKNIDFTR